jgi:hypothetical protein
LDIPELSTAIIEELVALFRDSLRERAAKLLVGDLDSIERNLQDLARSVLGRVVEEVVAAIAIASQDERPICWCCHQAMRLVAYERPRSLQGLVGDYALQRPYFVCDRCDQGCAPVDVRLGIGAGALSPGLQRVASRLGIDDSFADAVDALAETLRIELKDEAARRVTEGIGQVAEAEAQAAIALAQAGKAPLAKAEIRASAPVLLVEADGVMVHEVDGNWHEVKVGLAAPLGPEVRVDEETGRATLLTGKPNYCAGFEEAEAFWYRLYVEAVRAGLGGPVVKTVVVLADGAEWIWRRAGPFLAVPGVRVVEIVDIYHAFEHLGAVADAVFGPGTAPGQAWLGALKKRLEESGAGPVREALGELHPEGEAAAAEVRKAIGYFGEHARRMDYPKFIAMQLPIGSGAVESTCKTLIEEREKGAGMRWTKAGAQAVATLRAVHRSGRWVAFWKNHPQRRRPAVFRRQPTKVSGQTRLEERAA